MEKLKTNVLIIGKSGVGKSSLLNYMFDKELQKTGVGGAVTGKRPKPHDFKYDENFTISIYDSWGLEADKEKEWHDLIMDEVKEKDKSNIRDWFNTILFCLSANSARVEDFEIKTINSLLSDKNQITVVLTHCDSKDSLNANAMKAVLLKETKLKEDNIVFVNNIEKKLIGGKVERFGRDDVFIAIIKNLWKSLKTKVPYSVRNYVYASFLIEKQKIHNEILSVNLLINREKKINELNYFIYRTIKRYMERITYDINSKYNEAIDYYNSLSAKYAEISLLSDKFPKDVVPPDLIKSVMNKIRPEVNNVLGAIYGYASSWKAAERKIDKVILFVHNAGDVKKQTITAADEYLNSVYDKIDRNLYRIELKLENLNIEKYYVKQLKDFA